MTLHFLLEKEFKQIFRNRILPVVFVMLPLVLIRIIPFAATQEVKNLQIAVVDHDHSSSSQRLIQKICASQWFNAAAVEETYRAGVSRLDAGEADFVVEVGQDFERRLMRGESAPVMVAANGVNGIKSGLGSAYLNQIILSFSRELAAESGVSAGTKFSVSSRFLFNPELDYKTFMIPALMSMLLVLLVGFLPALNIVGEKEKGTIEQINVTPLSKWTFILSKLIPYWVIGLFILAYSMLLAWWFYDLSPAGSLWALLLFSSVFILIVSGWGLIVSNFSDTAQQAALVMFFFLIIFILMSGLITPVTSMPDWAKAIAAVNPLRYFIEAFRTIYMKPVSLADLLPHLRALSIFVVVIALGAVWSYRKQA
ncbi:MAG: ABC transporter permease [Alloprevotella sp.]